MHYQVATDSDAIFTSFATAFAYSVFLSSPWVGFKALEILHFFINKYTASVTSYEQ